VKRLDYEGELAFVVGKRAKRVLPEHAMEYILGYTCLNDVTARDIQKGDGQWTRGKSMDGFAPIGPVLTDEVSPDALHIETRLNGTVVQTGNTNLFMTKLPEMIAFITASMTLEPGDVVATGTPAGIGSMKPGDVVEVEIEGIGTLRNYVKAPGE
jgi:2-keto-4-pentenoate hydratase/2-oxohepta-3-ene-1,7-dioic acid hydratase in catechol pathway